MGLVCPGCDAEPSSELMAGAPCPACGTRLVIVDASDDRLEILLANPQLVPLERAAPSPPGLPVGAEPPGTLADAASAFAPPGAAAADDAPLELDAAWQASRTGTAVAIAHPPVTGGRPQVVERGRSLVGYVLVVAALAAGGWFAYGKLRPKPPETHGPAPTGVEIVITAPDPTPIEIDGHRAGKTPLRLKLPRGHEVMLITAPGTTPVQVTPDHDQVIELAPTR